MLSGINIDHSKCTRCGLCVKDCLNSVLEEVNGKVTAVNTYCIKCAHCIAICPTNAVTFELSKDNFPDMADIEQYVPEDFTLNPSVFLKAVKFRRSIRHYAPRQVEADKIRRIIEAGRYTPTAVNFQDVSFVVLQSRINEVQAESMRILRKIFKVVSWLNFALKLPVDAKRLSQIEDSFLFKKAPTVILTVSKNPIDASLATANMEMMATAEGLGVMHCGFFVLTAGLSRKIKHMLGLKKKDKIINCLCIGYPSVKYQRTAPRLPADIKWV